MLPMTHDHAYEATAALKIATSLAASIDQANADGEFHKAGRIAGRQRAVLKHAQTHALLAIHDELARIGLAQ